MTPSTQLKNFRRELLGNWPTEGESAVVKEATDADPIKERVALSYCREIGLDDMSKPNKAALLELGFESLVEQIGGPGRAAAIMRFVAEKTHESPRNLATNAAGIS